MFKKLLFPFIILCDFVFHGDAHLLSNSAELQQHTEQLVECWKHFINNLRRKDK